LKINVLQWPQSSRERSISSVPRSIIFLLVFSLLIQIVWHAQQTKTEAKVVGLSAAPSSEILELFSFGDPVALSRLLMLRLQSFDYQPGISIPFLELDYVKIVSWLNGIADLDQNSQYPLLAAARIYAKVLDPEKKRVMLEFVRKRFLMNPDVQWPAMAHAVFIAKHRLHDLDLALKYAKDIRIHLKRTDLHSWVRQMELFVLEDMGDLESARILLGGFLESGIIENEREFKFLQERLGAVDAE